MLIERVEFRFLCLVSCRRELGCPLYVFTLFRDHMYSISTVKETKTSALCLAVIELGGSSGLERIFKRKLHSLFKVDAALSP